VGGRGLEDEVRERLGQARLSHQGQEARFELTARELGLAADRSREGRLPSVPVGASDDVGDRPVVVELEALGLRERSFEAAFRHRRGEVEEGAGDGGGGDALVAGGVTGIEGP
jgi:hypothetical protein